MGRPGKIRWWIWGRVAGLTYYFPCGTYLPGVPTNALDRPKASKKGMSVWPIIPTYLLPAA